ncbi:MAG TPA: SPW repeat protein [Stellaceae bacterium]|nr:SPW repeat protein [Stellaceae bacterium]
MADIPMRHTTRRLLDENRALDWLLVALSIWFFISPWIIRFGGGAMGSHAAWDAWVIGGILFFVMLSAVGHLEASQEWMALVLGAWMFAAPWALGFTLLRGASWDHWVVGAVVFLIAAWNIWRLRHLPTAATTISRPPRQPLV